LRAASEEASQRTKRNVQEAGSATFTRTVGYLLLEETGVFPDEFLFLFRHIFQRVNRIGRARWHASPTIDAALRIHIHLSRGFEAGLVALGVDAVGGADFDAQGIFDARIGDYISHDESFSWNEYSLTEKCKKQGPGGAVIKITCRCDDERFQSSRFQRFKVSRFQGFK
jgi:hypothetical protein